MANFTLIEVDEKNEATVIGGLNDLREAPDTTNDITVYVLKHYVWAPVEVWVRDHLGNWWRHPAGAPLTHWRKDDDDDAELRAL